MIISRLLKNFFTDCFENFFTDFFHRDGSIFVWSCGKDKIIDPTLKMEETLKCCDIYDAGNGGGAGADEEMGQEQDGTSSWII